MMILIQSKKLLNPIKMASETNLSFIDAIAAITGFIRKTNDEKFTGQDCFPWFSKSFDPF